MLMRTKILTKIIIGFIVAIGVIVPVCAVAVPSQNLAGGPPAQVNCGGDTSKYSALYQMVPDSYDLYVKLGQPDQVAQGSVYFQAFSGTSCQTIGTSQTNGKSWTKVGVIISHGEDGFGTITFASSITDSLPGANRPTVMLVSKTDPVCQPTTDCFVNVNGRKASLQATGTLLNEDTLHVVTAKDPAKSTITRADYYVDSKFVYSAKNADSFNMNYVSSGKHTLITVINFSSKQQAIITRQVDRPYYDDLNYYLFTFVHEQRTLLYIACLAVLMIAIVESVFFVTRTIHHRRVWKATHFAHIDPNAPVVTAAEAEANQKLLAAKKPRIDGETVSRVVWLGGALIVSVMIIIMLNAWIVQIYQVDGPSMQSTLTTGDRLLVNKLGKTIASITNNKYIPKRGDVIVFIKASSTLFQSTGTEPPTFVVKRVIGLPGERVVVHTGIITVYNSSHPSGIEPDVGKPWTPDLHLQTTDKIDLTLGPDEIFVSGDNRPDSIDSRYYGAVKLNEIVGQATYRVLPAGKFKQL